MRRVYLLLPLLAACASDKYVHVEVSDGRSFYAKRAEMDKVDKYGMVNVENVITGKRLMVNASNCIVRSASRAEVARAQGNSFVYEK
jgi:hypothetical protein